MAWAMDQSLVENPTARHVLLVLANYADVNGKAAFPSAETLVRQTGLSERAVRNKLVEMEAMGVIVRGNQAIVQAYIDRGDRRPVCYDLAMPQEEKRGASGAPRKERGARGSDTGCTSFQNGVHVVPERGAGGAPNPPLNPSINPSLNKNHGIAVALPDWLPTAEWEKFVVYRKKGKAAKNFTQHAAELLLDDLIALRNKGNDPVEVIKQSIKRGWTGLFELSGGRGSQGARPSYHDERAATIAGLTGRDQNHESDHRTIDV